MLACLGLLGHHPRLPYSQLLMSERRVSLLPSGGSGCGKTFLLTDRPSMIVGVMRKTRRNDWGAHYENRVQHEMAMVHVRDDGPILCCGGCTGRHSLHGSASSGLRQGWSQWILCHVLYVS